MIFAYAELYCKFDNQGTTKIGVRFMSFSSNLSFWKLSLYVAAISTVATIVGPIDPQAAVALPRIPGVPVLVEDKADIYVKSKVGGTQLNLPLPTTLNGTAGTKTNPIYELGGKQSSKGLPYEIDVYKSGALDEVELTIPYSQVPLAARKLINSKVPGFKAIVTEKSLRPAKVAKFNSTVIYEVEGKNAKGKVVEVDVNPAGTYIVVTTPTF